MWSSSSFIDSPLDQSLTTLSEPMRMLSHIILQQSLACVLFPGLEAEDFGPPRRRRGAAGTEYCVRTGTGTRIRTLFGGERDTQR